MRDAVSGDHTGQADIWLWGGEGEAELLLNLGCCFCTWE